jgi:hypothetical protein
MADENDPRLFGQEIHLRSNVFHWCRYTQPSKDWDHDHCHFCFRRFAEPRTGYDDSVEYGYTTPCEYNWICKKCFDDFKDRFGWIVETLNGN